MSKKDNWKAFGSDTGHAFKNFGKAMGKTAKIATGNEENKVNEDGKTELKDAWSKTGKEFGKAGKALGKAAKTTFKQERPKKEDNSTSKDGAIDVESAEKN